ncbi:MAG: cellulose synthase/poly-beta-1,6-N-acetylglucosamine synthase-like glycosyltransferase [Pseudohongiellaceae bacterium]|jgi:cellulose synthase/poly-beta-1,6-N-acetylglucosamine synthase-like glycosyltransferase
MTVALLIIYWLAAAGLFVYGIHCYVLAALYLRHGPEQSQRREAIRKAHAESCRDHELPVVTVQLPVFNERFVVERLIDAALALDWPSTKLQIQVLDDSTDDTPEIVAAALARHGDSGVELQHLRRSERTGFKAGALAAGLDRSRGELVAILDADFVPHPDFLRQCIPFFADPQVGLVQARWGHLDRDHSWLTRLQALAIDGHFSVEQAGRCWSGLALNFNGTAGIWRRAAIDDAGGWQGDTLTEDLDLSYRAQLANWRVEFLVDVEVPAEIPGDIEAFKSQQRRWAKGSTQTAVKLLGRVWRSQWSFGRKCAATLHLTHYGVHPLMLIMALAAPAVLSLWSGDLGPLAFAAVALLLLMGAAGPSTLYVVAQRSLHRNWRRRLLDMPLLMVVGCGIAVSNGRAVFSGLFGSRGTFVRTPKRSLTDAPQSGVSDGYRLPLDPIFLVEGALALYTAWGLSLYLAKGQWFVGPFLALYALGFAVVSVCSAREVLAGLIRSKNSGVSPSVERNET